MRRASLALLSFAACNAPEQVSPPTTQPAAPSEAASTSVLDRVGGLRLTFSVVGADADDNAPTRVAAAFRKRLASTFASDARVYLLNHDQVVVDLPGSAAPEELRALRRDLVAPGLPSEVRLDVESTFGPSLP
ncbi:MAG: hypothetical protein AAF721_01005 [Myxococcota bacterium]